MGNSRRQQPVVIQQPVYQPPPGPSEAERSLLDKSNAQLAAMQSSYEEQIRQLNQQYARQSTDNSSIIEQLRQSLAAQEQSNARSRQDLEQANEASRSQLALLTSQRDASAAQLARQQETAAGEANSALVRLQRRRRARQTTY